MNLLFTPLTVGDLELPNRLIMAPLTRGRAGAENIPNEMMAEYYRQRASAGLIISEATHISPQGRGWVGAPGIPFLANPDLVERFRTGEPLNAPDFATFYAEGPKGYTDYRRSRSRAELSHQKRPHHE